MTSVDKPAVTSTSNGKNPTEVSFAKLCCGGFISLINPLSSFRNASNLNLSASNDLAPKLELELVIDISPPLVAWKCCA